jgi:flavin reductase (DIM6/NTAB) family NADH-FMN oxidoreductase RutF
VSTNERITRLPAGPARQRPQDAGSLRSVLGRFGTGVTVLSVGGTSCHGMTANSFTSVSLEPPLVLACVAKSASMHAAILAARSYGVSILGSHQERLARYFADRRRPSGVDQFDVTDWFPGAYSGAPLLVDSLAWLDCELVEAYDGGDHSIFVGRVLDMGRDAGGGALFFFEGDFHHMAPPAARSA